MFFFIEPSINANYEGDGSKEMLYVSWNKNWLSSTVFQKIKKMCFWQTHFLIEHRQKIDRWSWLVVLHHWIQCYIILNSCFCTSYFSTFNSFTILTIFTNNLVITFKIRILSSTIFPLRLSQSFTVLINSYTVIYIIFQF